MRSPVSAQLALDGAGTMVNCTIKSEEKKDPCHEAPQCSATVAEPQAGDPARDPPDAADPQAPAQVPSTFLGAPVSVSLGCLCTPHPSPTPGLPARQQMRAEMVIRAKALVW